MTKKQTSPATPKARSIQPPAEKLSPSNDLVEYFRQYARERPEVVALGCLGIGIVLGWKLKI